MSFRLLKYIAYLHIGTDPSAAAPSMVDARYIVVAVDVVVIVIVLREYAYVHTCSRVGV